MFDYARSELVGPNAGWTPHKNISESIKIIKRFIKSDEVFALVSKDHGRVIGSLGIHKSQPNSYTPDLTQREIGYVLHPNYWGNGLVPEAVNRVIKYCFEEMNLTKIWCGHFYFNTNSRRVNEKCGFKYQFTRNLVLKQRNNEELRTLYYSITHEDFYK
jgi:RimJ/RimL family protein N-acetyltransferase